MRGDFLIEGFGQVREATPPKQFFHWPLFQHLTQHRSSSAGGIRWEFGGDQQSRELLIHVSRKEGFAVLIDSLRGEISLFAGRDRRRSLTCAVCAFHFKKLLRD